MFILSKVTTLFLILYCIIRGRKELVFYNPYYILIISLVSFLLYWQGFGGFYMINISDSTTVFILLNFICLLLGFKVAKSKNAKPIETYNFNESYWLILLIGLLPTVVSVYLNGNVMEMEGSDMLEAKEHMILPGLGQLLYFLPAAVVVACKMNDTKKILIAISLGFIAALMTVSKTAVIVLLCFCLIGFTKFNPNILHHKVIKLLQKFALLWVPVLLVGFFYYNTTMRINADNRDYASYIDGNYTEVEGGMVMNYLYYCCPWSNLQYNITYNKSEGFGRNTFSQFAKKVGIEMKQTRKINPYFINVHSYLTDFYLDFGYIGTIIVSFFLGWLIFFFYQRFGLSDDPLLLSYYSLIAYASIMLFFSNHFVDGYLLNYFITFCGYSYIARKRQNI